MNAHRLLGLALALFIPFALAAAPEDAADLKAKVQRLVEQLGVPTKQVAAETELLKLGPDVLPSLPDEKAKLTPAQRERLRSIRVTLQEAQVLRELAPKTVTLQNPSIPLSQALEQIKQQTGMEVADLREDKTADANLKLNLQQAPFWQAVD